MTVILQFDFNWVISTALNDRDPTILFGIAIKRNTVVERSRNDLTRITVVERSRNDLTRITVVERSRNDPVRMSSSQTAP